VVIAVALDKDPEDARPWIEAAHPTHPSLIDTEFRLADLYHMVNVPTILWIDEQGRIIRPNDVAFGDDRFRRVTGLDSVRHLAMLRAWVRGDSPGLTAPQVRAWQRLPTTTEQRARAEFGLAKWLFDQGRTEAAGRHFVLAGELAPHDFTIRRGSMRMQGLDPMGPEFRQMSKDWAAAGHRYYLPLPDTAGQNGE